MWMRHEICTSLQKYKVKLIHNNVLEKTIENLGKGVDEKFVHPEHLLVKQV